VPASPQTSVRFIVPRKLFAIEDDTLKIPITPDDGSTLGKQIDFVDLFMTLDNTLFEPIDTDAAIPGIQPFTLGSNGQLRSASVQQIAHVIDGALSFELIYTDQTGLTFFGGVQTLVFANFKAKALTGGLPRPSFPLTVRIREGAKCSSHPLVLTYRRASLRRSK
jgi:hypothetical protein